jgi:two-component system sensor histidine kinase YesM
MTSIESSVSSEFRDASNVSKWIMESNEVLTYLKSDEKGTSGVAYDALNSIYRFTTSEDYLSSVYIFKNDKTYINISNGVTYLDLSKMDDSWYRDIIAEQGGYIIKVNGGGVFHQVSGKSVISFIRTIYDFNTQRPVGTLVMNYFDSILSDSYASFDNSKKKFAYFDISDYISMPNRIPNETENTYFNQNISTKEKKDSFVIGDKSLSDNLQINVDFTPKIIKDVGVRKSLYTERIPNSYLVLIEEDNTSTIRYLSPGVIISIVVFILITIISFGLFGIFLKYSITSPVEKLVASMDNVKNGWLRRVSLKLPDDEIGQLKDSYNQMLVEINKLIEELIEKETAYQKAELDALQEQIKPHFLYNTLDTIGYLSLEKPREEVYDAIETLGSFYRKFLSKGQSEISFLDEISITKNYLKLQKLRYGDILRDSYDIDEKAYKVKIPRLIFQPLVENAIYHGIRPKGEISDIKISAKYMEKQLVFTIYDNGVGTDKEVIEKILNDEDSKSFGLKKTLDRLKKYYDNKIDIEIDSKVGFYFMIKISVPEEIVQYI